MLGLLQPTDRRWVDAVEADLPAMLRDHAHCELKAAHSALSLLGRYAGEAPQLVAPLTALAREESEHFEQVHERLRARGENLPMPSNDAYVTALTQAARRNTHDGHPPLLDRLLVAGLIEGRSCERFKLLSQHLDDAELRRFYAELMASEARHFTLFTSLATELFGESATRARMATLAEREAEIVTALPLTAEVHG